MVTSTQIFDLEAFQMTQLRFCVTVKQITDSVSQCYLQQTGDYKTTKEVPSYPRGHWVLRRPSGFKMDKGIDLPQLSHGLHERILENTAWLSVL